MKRLAVLAGVLVALQLCGADAEPPHPDGWTWDELARRAGERADKAKVELLKAAARRQSVADDLAWKDPQLRLGHTWTDSRDRTGAGPGEPGLPPENGDGGTWTAGVRFYVSNPFVNRQLRLRGDAQVESLEACARAQAYAVYCEVKSLCLEEETFGRECAFCAEELKLADRIRALSAQRLESGVAKSPLDALRAEIARERAVLCLSEAEQARRRARCQISFLAGISERSLKIRATRPEPPSTNDALVAVLVETAFARRPDLAAALADFASARAGVGAAKAAHVPWFDFVEGTYSHQTASGEDWGTTKIDGVRVPERVRKSGRDDDWQVRVALSIPVFTWFGESVSRARLVADMADARVQALRASIENEIRTAAEAFRRADARFTRLSDDGGAFLKSVERRLDEQTGAPSASDEDVDRARLELVAYRRLRARAEYEWVRGVLLLESVTGGPLPHLPARTAKAAPPGPPQPLLRRLVEER